MFASESLLSFRTVPSEFYDDQAKRVLSIALRWGESARDVAGYELQVSTDEKNFASHAKFSSDAHYFEGYEIPWNRSAWFRLRAISANGRSQYSQTLKLTGVAPAMGLSLASPNPSTVIASWRAGGANASGYKLQRDTTTNFNSTSLREFVVRGRNNLSYTNSDSFPTGIAYYYRVLSMCAGGDSEAYEKPRACEAVIPNGPPLPPTFVTAHTTAVSANGETPTQIRIVFDRNSVNETGWKLERSPNSNDWVNVPVPWTGETRTVALVDGLAPNTLYHYRLAAVNSRGLSDYVTFQRRTPGIAPKGNTDWYIDPAAAGNGDGATWSNAWTSLECLNWTRLAPGHTVWIAGASYHEYLILIGSGSYGSPITFRAATDAAHNGKVRIEGQIAWLGNYLSVDGARQEKLLLNHTTDITNNCNIEVVGRGDVQPGLYGNVQIGCVAKWIEVHDCGNALCGENQGDGAAMVVDSLGPTNSELAYCWIHDNWGSGITQARGRSYGGMSGLDIHHVVVERNHNNFLMGQGSYDLHDSILRDWKAPGVAHPDGIQGGIDHVRIWNNTISASCPSGSMLYPDLNCTQANFYLVNNVFSGDYTDISFSMDNAPLQMALINVIVANNTFYGRKVLNFSLVNHGRPHRQLLGWIVKNNVFYTGPECSRDAAAFSTGGCEFSASDVDFDHNVVCGPSKIIAYRGAHYKGAEALNEAVGFRRNTSSAPRFAAPNDFALSEADTVAKDAGADLSALAKFLPDIVRDHDGVTRPQGAGWDIGAYECRQPAQRVSR